MPELKVIYWTMTGNTRIMADCLAEGAKQAGAKVQTMEVGQATPADALGCVFTERVTMAAAAAVQAAVQATHLSVFEPFFAKLLPELPGRKLALFGSYGWGGGEWLRQWQERARQAGANLYQHPNLPDGLAVQERPDAAALQLCLDFGAGFAGF